MTKQETEHLSLIDSLRRSVVASEILFRRNAATTSSSDAAVSTAALARAVAARADSVTKVETLIVESRETAARYARQGSGVESVWVLLRLYGGHVRILPEIKLSPE